MNTTPVFKCSNPDSCASPCASPYTSPGLVSCACHPGCPPDPCEKPDDPCVICPNQVKAYAYFHQLGRLYNSALLGAISLEQEPVQTRGFYYDTGIIHIFKPGIYMVTYIVNFPENETVSTTLALQMNNSNVPGTVRAINKNGAGVPYSATAQAVIRVETVSAIRLSSSKVIDYMTLPDNTVASLSLIEL